MVATPVSTAEAVAAVAAVQVAGAEGTVVEATEQGQADDPQQAVAVHVAAPAVLETRFGRIVLVQLGVAAAGLAKESKLWIGSIVVTRATTVASAMPIAIKMVAHVPL